MHEWYGSWVENDRFGIDMKYNSIFMVWEGWVGMDSTLDMNEDGL